MAVRSGGLTGLLAGQSECGHTKTREETSDLRGG